MRPLVSLRNDIYETVGGGDGWERSVWELSFHGVAHRPRFQGDTVESDLVASHRAALVSLSTVGGHVLHDAVDL